MVEQIGYDGEVDAPITLADLECRGDRQVSFPNADAAPQVEPAMLGIRVAGKRAGNFESLFRSRNRLEILERVARESVKIRETAQRLALSLGLLAEPALAVDQPPKIGWPTGTSMRTQPASLQTGQRQVGVAVAEPLLPAGPTGIEREVRTSPIRFIGFSAAPR